MNRKLACLTIDMEPDYGDPEGHIRLLEDLEYFERYTSIINRYSAKVTMFTVTSLFEHFGEHFKRLADCIPLEYAAHSHTHDPAKGAARDEVENAAQAMRQVNRKSVLGYRAPYGQITREGLGNLLDAGYHYDASIYTSVRPGKFGYANLHVPNDPFRIRRGGESLVEFPFTSLSRVRIIFGLSYVKLLGWGTYSALWRAFGLPDITLALSHPHDFYFHRLAAFHPASAEKLAMTRNADKAFDYYEKVVDRLQKQGYEFAFVSEAFEEVKSFPSLSEFDLASWR